MDNRWLSVLFFSGMAGIATLVGMYLVLAREAWGRRNSAYLISFSAGVMLGVGFLHILPEAQNLTANAPLYLVIAFVVFYFLEHHLPFHADHEQLHHSNLSVPASHDHDCAHPHPLGSVAFFGMSLHSLIDGMIIGSGFELDAEIGLLSALAVIAHKIPAGVSIFSILLHYGYRKVNALAFTSAVAVATPVGAILTYAVIRQVDPELLGILMAVAAGSFIYIAASDLIPESHRTRGFKGSFSLCGGILAALAAGWIAH